MYLPPHFQETRIDLLQRLISDHNFGTLVTLDPARLDANHLPFEYDPMPAPFGTLRAHVARNNPVWHTHPAGIDVLAIFQAAHSYISPAWYPTKRENGKVVPTYNYLVVHAHGPMRTIEDPVWLRALVERLTQRHEAGRAMPWQVSDAPSDFIDKMLAAIVGLEIPIARLTGKWKASQNQPQANRAGVSAGLRERGDANSAALADFISTIDH